jgi:hypothetical protein
MKINKIMSFVIILEFFYALFRIIPNFLITFDPAIIFPYFLVFFSLILLLSSAIGIFFNKRWAIFFLWIFILLPFLSKMLVPFVLFIGGYYFVIINVVIATYLSIKNWQKIAIK